VAGDIGPGRPGFRLEPFTAGGRLVAAGGRWLWGSARPAWSTVAVTGPDVRAAGLWQLDRDPYLLETSVPGIFASGDVRFSPVKRVAAAVGEGSMAIAFVHQYLKENA
jgi:NADPH-dependent glutamate synthase beta subunit-like oxidoreductase